MSLGPIRRPKIKGGGAEPGQPCWPPAKLLTVRSTDLTWLNEWVRSDWQCTLRKRGEVHTGLPGWPKLTQAWPSKRKPLGTHVPTPNGHLKTEMKEKSSFAHFLSLSSLKTQSCSATLTFPLRHHHGQHLSEKMVAVSQPWRRRLLLWRPPPQKPKLPNTNPTLSWPENTNPALDLPKTFSNHQIETQH